MGYLQGLSARRRATIVVAAVMVLVGVTVAAVGISRRSDDATTPSPTSLGRPGHVLLIPGYGGGTAGLDVLAERLRAAGRTATVVPVGDGRGDLAEQAEVVNGFVEAALDAGAPSVDIVGYSAGGVVARVWALEHDGDRVARRIVTLGSPHQGAEIAAAGAALVPGACPAACQQLVPGSSLLSELPLPVPEPPEWVSLWTTGDEVVTPPSAAELDGAHNLAIQSICPDAQVAHSQLPTDPRVAAVVIAAIGPGPLEIPEECVSS